MTYSPSITQDQIRLLNRSKILRELLEKGVATKHELGQALSLSHTTINTCIQLLLEEGLVENTGLGRSVGGRKPVMVGLKADARYAFGVYIAPGTVDILLVNLLGQEVERRTLIRGQDDFEQMLDTVHTTIWDMIHRRAIDPAIIVGVGMSFPGVVYADRYFVEYAPNLGIRNYSFDAFRQKLGLKLYLENESIAATYAEQLIGGAKRKGNIVYVSIADGIGTGIVIDNRILRDISKKAGDFGHIKVRDEGLPCRCGRTDCWELYASKNALLRYYRESLDKDADAVLPMEELRSAYERGEAAAVKAVEKYTYYLFRGIEIILLALSPEEIIVGGDLGDFTQEIIRLGTGPMQLNKRFYGYEDVPITASGFTENGAIIGSAFLPLETIYSFRDNGLAPMGEVAQ